MNLDARGKAKLARFVRYGAFALIAAWSLLALAIYAVLGTVAGWMAQQGWADGWIAWSGQLAGQAGGAAVAILWLAGMFVILGAIAVIRRFAA
jgi:membrane associated rhomboid family serine protease